MPPDADLIRIVFASGPPHVNREVIDRIAALQPELPLLVVAEFEPHRGHWIPYHPLRRDRENRAAVRAALVNKRIETAAMVLAPAVPLKKMRLIAMTVAAGSLIAFDEDLKIVGGAGWGKYFLRRVEAAARSHRTRQWLRRIAHPDEAEIPVARASGADLRAARQPLSPGATGVSH